MSTHPPLARLALAGLCLSAGLASLAACSSTGTVEDAGPEPSGTCSEGEPAVVAGVMGVTQCTDEGCAFGGAPCEEDGDCFTPLEDGDILPAWDRPQGGIGTRYNVRLDGVPDDDDRIEFIRTVIVLSRAGTSCDPAGCPGAGCPCDDGADETCLSTAAGDECAVVLVDQLNRTFPTECRGDNHVHVEEIPIRFGIGFSLAEVDGAPVELILTAGFDQQTYEAPIRHVTLQVGDFIYPASFDPLGGRG